MKVRAENAGMDGGGVNDWCKENYEGRTWSKLSEEEQIEALLKLDTLSGKEFNPLVEEAKKMGAVEK